MKTTFNLLVAMKTLFISLTLCLISQVCHGQINNDYCVGATNITIPLNEPSATIPVNINYHHPSFQGELHIQNTEHTEDAWYTFTATSETTLFKMDEYYEVYLSLFTGNCNDLNNVSENLNFYQITKYLSTEIGQEYYLRISKRKFYENTSNFSFTLENYQSPTAPNQNCSTAEELTTIGATCTNSIDIIYSAFQYSDIVETGCHSNDFDLWYSFTAPATGKLYFDFDKGYEKYSIYSNSCGSITLHSCHASDGIVSDLVPSNIYYLRLIRSPYSTNSLCITDASDIIVNTNIDCASAETYSGQVNGELGRSISVEENNCSNSLSLTRAVWYTFLGPSSGSVFIESDAYQMVFSGSCMNLDTISCISNGYVDDLNNGELYYIRSTFKPSSSSGASNDLQFSLLITDADDLPAYDRCAGATPVDVVSDCGSGSTSYSMTNLSRTDLCNYDEERWFSFIAPPSGVVDNENGYIQRSLFAGTCDELDRIHNFSNQKMDGLIPGELYYMSVEASSLSTTVSFCLEEVIPSTVLPNEICQFATPLALTTTLSISLGFAVREVNQFEIGCTENKRDLWYSIVADENFILLEKFNLYTGICGSLTLVEGDYYNPTTKLYDSLIDGETYYLRVTSNGSYSIDVLDPQSIIYTECANALLIDLTDVGSTHSQIGLPSLSDIPIASCIQDDSELVDSWYVFTASSESIIITEPNIVIYEGTCEGLTEKYCSTQGYNYLTDFVIGVDYYIRHYNSASSSNAITIANYEMKNGKCELSKTIHDISEYYVSNIISSLTDGSTDLNYNGCGNQKSFWYDFVAPTTGQIKIYNQNSFSGFTIYGSDCDLTNEIHCETATTFGETQSMQLTPGESYKLRVSGSIAKFSIKYVIPIPNETNCNSGGTLSVSTDDTCEESISGSTVNAISANGKFCGSNQMESVFYEFSPSEDGNFRFAISNETAPHRITLFENCTLSASVACGNTMVDALLTSGQNYIVAVSPQSTGLTSTFDLCVYISEGINDGSVGINTSNPQAKLDVNGGIRPGYSNNTQPGVIRWNGDLEVHDGTQWLSTTQWDHQVTMEIDMNNHRLTNLDDPVLNTDAATKSYVDNLPAGDLSNINELQQLTKSGNTITLSNSGGSITDDVDDADNDPNNEIETWTTLAGIPTDIADGDDVDDADNDPTNEIETWTTLAGIPTDIADGDDVDDADNDPNNEIETWTTLAGIPTDIADGDDVDDADNDPTNEIETWTTLAGIPTDIADGDDVDDADNDPNNEIETWTTLAGIPTDIADGDDVDDADNDPNNEIETWTTLAGIPTDIADGDDVDDADASITNEKINSVSLTNTQLTINEGAQDYMVNLAGLATPWSKDVTDIYINEKVGISITDPQKELDIDGEVQISTNSNGSVFQLNLIENNSGYSRLNFTNTSNKDITLAAIPSATPANSKLNFFIEDAGDVMTMTGEKRIGINNGNPQSDLHIKHKDGPANGGMRIENTDGASTNYWNMYVASSSDELRLYANNTKVGGFDFASGAYTSVSDERMKSGIQPLHFEWSKFMLLNAANYSFLHDVNKRQYLGLLAQEVQEIYPELVQYDEEEDTYRLDYSGTGVIAIKAVQELKNENDELRKENQEIKKLLLDLQQQINAINEKK